VPLFNPRGNLATPGIREEIWPRLAGAWKPRHLDKICHEQVALDGMAEIFSRILSGQSLGRVVVKL